MPQEFVSRAKYDELGDNCLIVMDDRILITAEQLRDQFGQTIINDWVFKGHRQFSGFRGADDEYYRQNSQHSFGRAIDCVFKEVSSHDVREYIFKNPNKFPYITGVETGISWLHVDCRYNNTNNRFIKFAKNQAHI